MKKLLVILALASLAASACTEALAQEPADELVGLQSGFEGCLEEGLGADPAAAVRATLTTDGGAVAYEDCVRTWIPDSAQADFLPGGDLGPEVFVAEFNTEIESAVDCLQATHGWTVGVNLATDASGMIDLEQLARTAENEQGRSFGPDLQACIQAYLDRVEQERLAGGSPSDADPGHDHDHEEDPGHRHDLGGGHSHDAEVGDDHDHDHAEDHDHDRTEDHDHDHTEDFDHGHSGDGHDHDHGS